MEVRKMETHKMGAHDDRMLCRLYFSPIPLVASPPEASQRVRHESERGGGTAAGCGGEAGRVQDYSARQCDQV